MFAFASILFIIIITYASDYISYDSLKIKMKKGRDNKCIKLYMLTIFTFVSTFAEWTNATHYFSIAIA